VSIGQPLISNRGTKKAGNSTGKQINANFSAAPNNFMREYQI
jgi:hypothetical protein